MRGLLSPGLRAHDEVVEASMAAIVRLANEEPVPAHELGAPETTPGLSAWALVVDRMAVVCAWTFLHHQDCGIYAVGTLPAWRRKGLARMLLEHVLADAQRRGARTASLQSTRMGQPLYESLGFTPSAGTRNGSRTDRLAHADSRGHAGVMAVDVSTEITIDRPVDERGRVRSRAGERAAQWYVNIESVEWKTEPPLAVGSRMEFVADFLGRRLAVHLRGRRTRPRRAVRDAHRRRTVPDGDDLHLGRPRERDEDDVAQPRGAQRLLADRGTAHGAGDAAREPEGPAATQVEARSLLIDGVPVPTARPRPEHCVTERCETCTLTESISTDISGGHAWQA